MRTPYPEEGVQDVSPLRYACEDCARIEAFLHKLMCKL